jgi:hypothetical protein
MIFKVHTKAIRNLKENGVKKKKADISRTKTPCPIPAVLHVNQEARNEALKYYELNLACTRPISRAIFLTTPPQIYVNYACDRICGKKYNAPPPLSPI